MRPSGTPDNADWMAESDQENAWLGYSVSTAGDVNGDGYSDVIVGAYGYDSGENNEGRAYVYHGSPSGLSTSAAWTAESDHPEAELGNSVSTAGDVNRDGFSDVIIGANLYDVSGGDEGRAFVYHGSSSGLDLEEMRPSGTPDNADWMAESDQPAAQFGGSVSTAGDVNGDGFSDVVVGARWYDNGENREGRAYVYHGSSSGLSTSAAWTAESDQEDAQFGVSVSTAGDVNGDGYSDVIVGAYFYDNGEGDEGRAFVYHGSSSGLDLEGTRLSGTPENADWTAEPDQTNAWFGVSVSTAGDVNGDGYSDVIVGAFGYSNREGRATVYHGSSSGLNATAAWTAESDHTGAWFGYSLASAGDVNGDGYSDVIVGAIYYDNGEWTEGRVFVYHGSSSGLSTAVNWTAEPNKPAAEMGWSVDTAGDVNDDGYSDVIVGAYLYENGEYREGRAFVYHGSATGLDLDGTRPSGTAHNADWVAESNIIEAYFGHSVGTAGDVNGDGYSDVIVGAPWYYSTQNADGRAFVYHGSSSGLSTTANWTAELNQGGAFGWDVGTAGDVNGDGYSDVIVAAPGLNGGRAFVYHGSASSLSQTPNWSGGPNQGNYGFGRSVGTAGDVNGDGYSDVIVGCPGYENGRAFVWYGSSSSLGENGTLSNAAWAAETDTIGAMLGDSVGTAGDVNGDGHSDIIVGAYMYDPSRRGKGAAFVYHGSATGLDPNGTRPFGTTENADWTAQSGQDWSEFGHSVATAGDVNGDGYSDVIVGSPRYDHGEHDEGQAFLYYGNSGVGLSLAPRQLRVDESVPIAHLGKLDFTDGFRLAMVGRTPYGRGRVKLEWEVKPLGTFFDGEGTEKSGSFIPNWDDGTGWVVLNELVDDLTGDTVYHWRMRLLYDPATLPFQQHSRWVTMPYSGWQEANLRTATCTDTDGDGYGVCPDCGTANGCDYDGDDCDDGDDSINPGATDVPCDGIDQDCSGADNCAMPASQSYDTHFAGTKQGPDPLACDDCHGSGYYTLSEMVAAGDCDRCHSPDGAFDGVNDPDIGAGIQTNWDSGVYETDGTTLKPGKEKWCAGCHDNDPAYSQPCDPDAGGGGAAVEVVVDNEAASYAGDWGLVTGKPCAYNNDFRWDELGTGTDTCTWTPDLPEPGSYKVYARWVAHANRASDAPYTITYDGGSVTVDVDQQVDGCQWNLLGTFPFDAGTAGTITLSDEADEYVIADAVKLTLVDTSDMVLDNTEAVYSSYEWATVTGKPCACAEDFQWDAPGDGDTCTWTPDIAEASDYRVYARWVDHANRASNAPYTITYSGGSETVDVDQRIQGCQWNLLGTYPFDIGTGGSIVLSDDADGYLISDAIRVVKSNGCPDGTYAPDVASAYYSSGHKIDCLSCHDAGQDHIDHQLRTYGSSSDNYQAGYRLKSVNGSDPMNIPRPKSTGDAHDYLADFALCFSCHNSSELLGTSDKTDASQTNFQYNNGNNGHFTHLVMGKKTGFDSDFDGVNDSDFTCTACHNVHGSTTPAMTRDGALIAASRTDLPPDFGALHFSYVGGATLVDSTGSQIVLGGGNVTTNGMCNAACHSAAVTCYRTPYYAPRVMSCPDIDAVFNDGVDTTLVTAYVLDHEPGTVPAVTVDATAMGGASGQPMYDDGATGGDLVAGDHVYTWETATTVTGGSKRLDVTAADGDGTGTNDVEVQVIDPDELIMDNEDAAYTGTWPLVEGNACAYEDDFQWNEGGTGADTATWTPTIYQAGDYEVYAWWVPHENRATDAPYTINYDGGSVTVDVDCTTNGCDWRLLGTYPFAVGTAGSVVLSDHANGYVIADAIRWVRQ